jgi:hypothetical protein
LATKSSRASYGLEEMIRSAVIFPTPFKLSISNEEELFIEIFLDRGASPVVLEVDFSP